MNSEEAYTYYNYDYQYNNNNNYSNNNNYTQYTNYYSNNFNNNSSVQNNYNNENNKYGNIIKYYNNYPVYSYIPPSIPQQNVIDIKVENTSNKEKENPKNTKLRRGIMLNIKKEDMCYLRPPEFQDGYIQQTYGKPNYIEKKPE